MEQLNQVLPENQEENQVAAVALSESKDETSLLSEVRRKFGIFGGISLCFGVLFTFSFYKAEIGLNVFLFTMVMIGLLILCMKQLKLPVKKGTIAYYAGASLFGLSTVLTASVTLQFFNFLAILCLFNLSLLHQLQEDSSWDFAKYLTRMTGIFFHGLAAIGMPFADCVRYLKHTKLFKNEKVMNVFLGIVIALPLLWIIIILLSGADLLFGDITKNMNEFFISPDIIAVALMILFGFFSCYCILCGAVSQADRPEGKARRKAASTIAVTVTFLICLVYFLFCAIQMIYLFAGGLFILPDGYTFAEYARRGFFELLAVTIINIVLMLICNTFFEDSKFLRILLTCMTVCTYIMIASAAYRMLLYIGAYHLTFLRLFVLLALLIDSLVLAGVIAAVYRKGFPLFRYCTAVITVCYLVFSFAKPDYYIAAYLIDQKEILEMEDAEYLTQELSVDAAAVVLPVLNKDSRWSEEVQYSVDNNNDYGMFKDYEEWGTLESYKENYYNRIQTQADMRGIRDFNYSIWEAKRH